MADATVLWSTSDIGRHLGVSRETTRKVIAAAGFPAPTQTTGRTRLWDPALIKSWIAIHRPAPTGGATKSIDASDVADIAAAGGLTLLPGIAGHIANQAAAAEGGSMEMPEEELAQERDTAESWADRLAYAIAPIRVIGEHASENNPWARAVDEAVRLRARVAELESEIHGYQGSGAYDLGVLHGSDAAAKEVLRDRARADAAEAAVERARARLAAHLAEKGAPEPDSLGYRYGAPHACSLRGRRSQPSTPPACQAPAPQAPAITDAMVRAAIDAALDHHDGQEGGFNDGCGGYDWQCPFCRVKGAHPSVGGPARERVFRAALEAAFGEAGPDEPPAT